MTCIEWTMRDSHGAPWTVEVECNDQGHPVRVTLADSDVEIVPDYFLRALSNHGETSAFAKAFIDAAKVIGAQVLQ